MAHHEKWKLCWEYLHLMKIKYTKTHCNLQKQEEHSSLHKLPEQTNQLPIDPFVSSSNFVSWTIIIPVCTYGNPLTLDVSSVFWVSCLPSPSPSTHCLHPAGNSMVFQTFLWLIKPCLCGISYFQCLLEILPWESLSIFLKVMDNSGFIRVLPLAGRNLP